MGIIAKQKFFKASVSGYFSDVRNELLKVTWPTRQKVVRSSLVIIAMMIFFAVYISGLDLIISRLFSFFTRGS